MTDPDIREKQRTVLLLRQMQAKLDAAERRAREPVAVIGIGCRMPGGIDGPEAFWDMLEAGTDAVSEVPPERWDADAFYDPDPDRSEEHKSELQSLMRISYAVICLKKK